MIQSQRSTRSVVRMLVCASALGLMPMTAHAQSVSSLPPSTVEAISIGAAQQTQIQDFIENWSERALSGDAIENKKAMEALTKPMHQRGVSIAFRQSYAQSLTSLMDDLEAQETIAGTISSLRLAGALSTPSSVNRISDAMSHEDLGIQIFAASRMQKVFSNCINHSPAIATSEVHEIISVLAESAMQGDANEELIRSCVRALIRATSLPSDELEDSRSKAIIALADVVGSQLRSLSVTDDPTFAQSLAVNSTSAITNSILDISAETSTDATRAAVGLAGDTISVALRRTLGNTLKPVSMRDMTVQSVQAGESLLYFAWRKHAELTGAATSSITQTNFASMLSEGEDKDFRIEASSLLGPGTPIIRTFGFNEKRFLN